MLAKILERAVAVGKVGAKFFKIAPAKTGERLCANVRQFTQSAGLRHGPIMQHVIPCEICSGKSDLPEGAGDGLAVGDVKHEERLTRKSVCPGTVWELRKFSASLFSASLSTAEDGVKFAEAHLLKGELIMGNCGGYASSFILPELADGLLPRQLRFLSRHDVRSTAKIQKALSKIRRPFTCGSKFSKSFLAGRLGGLSSLLGLFPCGRTYLISSCTHSSNAVFSLRRPFMPVKSCNLTINPSGNATR